MRLIRRSAGPTATASDDRSGRHCALFAVLCPFPSHHHPSATRVQCINVLSSCHLVVLAPGSLRASVTLLKVDAADFHGSQPT